MQKVLGSRITAVITTLIFVLAMGWCALQGATPATPVDTTPAKELVAHGPSMPPYPWEPVTIAHGPSMPPYPWEPVTVAHGPSMPPYPWEPVTVAHGPSMPPYPWEPVTLA